MSVVVVVTVLLILSDYCRLSFASNPVGFEICFFTLTKKELCIRNEKMYENSILFSGPWQIIFHVLSAIFLNATDEI